MKQIGQIELLVNRIYKLDADCACMNPSTVVVPAGIYPLFSDGFSTYWVMRGKMNMRGPWRMGDGMFSMSDGDVLSEIEVEFPSRRFGADEWADLLTEDTFTEGNEYQRFLVTITEK